MTGAAYGVLVVVVWSVVDPGDSARELLGALMIIGLWAAVYGAAYAVLPGLLGALALWALAELNASRSVLLLAGALGGAALGWFWVDAVVAADLGPTLSGRADLLMWRAGPAAAGACGATWQAARTGGRRALRVG